MKVVICAVILIVASIEAREVPKIQIYEIRAHGNNGIQLRDLELDRNGFKRAESKLLNLFKPKKQDYKRKDATEQLIEKFKSLKGDEGNRVSDDAYIYVINNAFDDNGSKQEEVDLVVDRNRNDRVRDQQRNDYFVNQSGKRVVPNSRNEFDQQKLTDLLIDMIMQKKPHVEKRTSEYSRRPIKG